MSSYNSLSYVYDELMGHVDYKKVTEYYINAAKRWGLNGVNVLDLACGTGNMTIELLKRGYMVHGLDASSDMLAVADEKIYKEGFEPRLFCQNMKEFCAPIKYDLVISAFDSLNYLLDIEDLSDTINNVSKVLKKDALFLFDVHTKYKMEEVFGQNVFTYTDEDIAYIWQNDFSPEEEICHMDIEIFVQKENDTYKRISEYHRERYYSRESIERVLEDKGFEVLAIYGDFIMETPRDNTERICYVCRSF